MAAFGLLAGSVVVVVVVVVVRLLTVDKAVEKSGAYFSKLKCTQKYAPRINDMQYPYIYTIICIIIYINYTFHTVLDNTVYMSIYY